MNAGQSDRWDFFPHFILRSTGFPLALLDRIRTPESCRLLSAGNACARAVASLKDEYLHPFDQWVDSIQAIEPKGSPVFTKLYTARRHVLKQQSIPAELLSALPRHPALPDHWYDRWHAALAEEDHTWQAAEQALSGELTIARAELARICHDPRLRHALLLSNPEIPSAALPYLGRDGQAGNRSGKSKHMERRMVSYLQRFAAKNDTNSFFGPLQYGTLPEPGSSSDQPAPAISFEHHPHLVAYRGFFSHRATRILAERIAAEQELRPHLPVSLRAELAVTSQNQLVNLVTGQATPLPPSLAAVLTAFDSYRTSAMVAHHLNLDPQWLSQQIEQLERKGLVACRLEVPVATQEPLQYLRSRLAEMPACTAREHWLCVLDKLAALCQAWDRSDGAAQEAALSQLEQIYREATGADPRWAPGQMYADRTLVHQECHGPVRGLQFSPALAGNLAERLEPALDLAAAYGALKRLDYRAAALRLFRELAGSGERLPLVRFIHEGSRFEWGTAPRATALRDELIARVAARGQEMPYTPGRPWVARFTATEWYKPPADLLANRSLLASPDIMLAAESRAALDQGDWKLVIGEIHWGLQVFTNLLCMSPDARMIQNDARQWLTEIPHGPEMAQLILTNRFGKMFYQEIFPTSIEMLGRSVQPADRILPIRDLSVQLQDGELVLTSPQGAKTLYMGDPGNPLSAVFSEPVAELPDLSLGEHTPRIEIGDMVLQRERWDVDAASVPAVPGGVSPLAAYRAVWAWREELGLPAQVYMKSSVEVKPFYIDFTSYLSAELFLHIAAKGGRLKITESLPGPGELWLERDGHRFCNEFRIACYRRPERDGETRTNASYSA